MWRNTNPVYGGGFRAANASLQVRQAPNPVTFLHSHCHRFAALFRHAVAAVEDCVHDVFIRGRQRALCCSTNRWPSLCCGWHVSDDACTSRRAKTTHIESCQTEHWILQMSFIFSFVTLVNGRSRLVFLPRRCICGRLPLRDHLLPLLQTLLHPHKSQRSDTSLHRYNISSQLGSLTNLSLPGTLDATSANLLPAASSAYMEAGNSLRA